jgi:3-methyladenine DNA glycosylase AlkD
MRVGDRRRYMDEKLFKLVDTSTRVFLPMALVRASMPEAAEVLRALPLLTVNNAQEMVEHLVRVREMIKESLLPPNKGYENQKAWHAYCAAWAACDAVDCLLKAEKDCSRASEYGRLAEQAVVWVERHVGELMGGCD